MCEKIEHWNIKREQENLVEDPEMLDLYLNKNFNIAKLSWMAKKIVKDFQFLLIRFVLTTEVLAKIILLYLVLRLVDIIIIGCKKN